MLLTMADNGGCGPARSCVPGRLPLTEFRARADAVGLSSYPPNMLRGLSSALGLAMVTDGAPMANAPG